eukprot:s3561_g4.t1
MAGGCHVPALFVSVLFCWEVLSEATGAAECGQNDLVNLLQVPQQGLGFLFLDAYPSQYVARRLADGQSITIDGNLNESVWEEVPFTTTAFKDIAQPLFPDYLWWIGLNWSAVLFDHRLCVREVLPELILATVRWDMVDAFIILEMSCFVASVNVSKALRMYPNMRTATARADGWATKGWTVEIAFPLHPADGIGGLLSAGQGTSLPERFDPNAGAKYWSVDFSRAEHPFFTSNSSLFGQL